MSEEFPSECAADLKILKDCEKYIDKHVYNLIPGLFRNDLFSEPMNKIGIERRIRYARALLVNKFHDVDERHVIDWTVRYLEYKKSNLNSAMRFFLQRHIDTVIQYLNTLQKLYMFVVQTQESKNDEYEGPSPSLTQEERASIVEKMKDFEDKISNFDATESENKNDIEFKHTMTTLLSLNKKSRYITQIWVLEDLIGKGQVPQALKGDIESYLKNIKKLAENTSEFEEPIEEGALPMSYFKDTESETSESETSEFETSEFEFEEPIEKGALPMLDFKDTKFKEPIEEKVENPETVFRILVENKNNNDLYIQHRRDGDGIYPDDHSSSLRYLKSNDEEACSSIDTSFYDFSLSPPEPVHLPFWTRWKLRHLNREEVRALRIYVPEPAARESSIERLMITDGIQIYIDLEHFKKWLKHMYNKKNQYDKELVEYTKKLLQYPFIRSNGLGYDVIYTDGKFTEDFFFDCKYIRRWWERLLGLGKNKIQIKSES